MLKDYQSFPYVFIYVFKQFSISDVEYDSLGNSNSSFHVGADFKFIVFI